MSSIVLDYDSINQYLYTDFNTILNRKIAFFKQQIPTLNFDKYGRAFLTHTDGIYTEHDLGTLAVAIIDDIILGQYSSRPSIMLNTLDMLGIEAIFNPLKGDYSYIKDVHEILNVGYNATIGKAIHAIVNETFLFNNELLKIIKSGHKVNYKFSKLIARYSENCLKVDETYQYYVNNSISDFLTMYDISYLEENPYIVYQQMSNAKKSADIYLSVNPLDMITLSAPLSTYSTCMDTLLYNQYNSTLIEDNDDIEFSNPLLNLLNSCILNKALIYVPNSHRVNVNNYGDFYISGYCYRNIVWLDSDALYYSVDYPCNYIIKNSIDVLRNDFGYDKIINTPSDKLLEEPIINFLVQDTKAIYHFLNYWREEYIEYEYSSIYLDRVCINLYGELQAMPSIRGTYNDVMNGIFNPITEVICSNCKEVIFADEVRTIDCKSMYFEERLVCPRCYEEYIKKYNKAQ